MTDPHESGERGEDDTGRGSSGDSVGHDILELFNSDNIVEDPHDRYEPSDPDDDGDPLDADAPAPPG